MQSKKIVYSYYGMDGDAYDEMLRSNREAYRKLCPDSRFRKRNNSYRILLFPIKLSYFEERINRDYKKNNGTRLPHPDGYDYWWDSSPDYFEYCPD